MNDQQKTTARACLEAAEKNSMTFPQIIGSLIEAGFESYTINFQRAVATYYLPGGESLELPSHKVETAVGAAFEEARIQSAIREAQQLVPGYTYRGFCEKAAAAGCAAYMVSFLGRRALYIGRTGETHTEHFPD